MSAAAEQGRSARAVLEQRARELARPAEPERRELIEVVCFSVGEARYAVPTDELSEVVVGSRLARVPNAPPSLLGVMSLRGSLLPVFALAGTGSELRHVDWVIVLGDTDPLALAVDEVDGVSSLDPAQLVPVPVATEDGRSAGHVRGVAQDGTALLDVAALIADSRFSPYRHPNPRPRTEPR